MNSSLQDFTVIDQALPPGGNSRHFASIIQGENVEERMAAKELTPRGADLGDWESALQTHRNLSELGGSVCLYVLLSGGVTALNLYFH